MQFYIAVQSCSYAFDRDIVMSWSNPTRCDYNILGYGNRMGVLYEEEKESSLERM